MALGGLALAAVVAVSIRFAVTLQSAGPAPAPAVVRGLRLQLAPDGVLTPSCGNSDGAAVDFSFHYLNDPADRLQGDRALLPGQPLERNLLVRLNTTLAQVLLPRRWEFSRQDTAYNAFTGGIFPTVNNDYDAMVSGHLLITSAGPSEMEGSIDVVLQSGRWVREPFKVRLKPRNPDLICG